MAFFISEKKNNLYTTVVLLLGDTVDIYTWNW